MVDLNWFSISINRSGCIYIIRYDVRFDLLN